MVNIKTTDVTPKSVGAVKVRNSKNNTAGTTATTTNDPKEQLRNIKTQKKELNNQLKGLTKQETQIKRQISKLKTANKK